MFLAAERLSLTTDKIQKKKERKCDQSEMELLAYAKRVIRQANVDGPRNLEPSQAMCTSPELALPLLSITPTGTPLDYVRKHVLINSKVVPPLTFSCLPPTVSLEHIRLNDV
ncbi:hypothetical protein TNCV_3511971 [Trichonephila clavipes]|nr:hypothetical protein TNCV_3511971 [Trichonephila clavipes]